jgi:hypothetical protein
MTRASVLVVAVAIGVGAGVVWMVAPGATPKSPPTPINAVASPLDAQRLARLEHEVARMETRASTDRASSNQQPTAMPGNEAAPVEPNEEPALSYEQSVANERAVVREVAVGLADALERETVDASWAEETEAAIAEVLGEETFRNLELTRVECRRSLCRVDVAVADAEHDAEERIGQLTEVGPFRNGGFADFSNPDAVGMFIARKGHTLPSL